MDRCELPPRFIFFSLILQPSIGVPSNILPGALFEQLAAAADKGDGGCDLCCVFMDWDLIDFSQLLLGAKVGRCFLCVKE